MTPFHSRTLEPLETEIWVGEWRPFPGAEATRQYSVWLGYVDIPCRQRRAGSDDEWTERVLYGGHRGTTPLPH